MKNSIPFIIIENDINLRIFRFLLIINRLAYTKKGKLAINIDRLGVFDFLLKYPLILKQVLQVRKQTDLKLLKEEVETVSSLFPSKSALLDNNSTKEIVKLMIAQDLLKVIKDKNELFFVLTDKAIVIVSEINTDYSRRINELCIEMLTLRSVSVNDLKKIINPLVEGE